MRSSKRLCLLFIVSLYLFAAPLALADQSRTVKTAQSEAYGTYLVDGEGRSLYLFVADKDGQSTCHDACRKAWPPLTVRGDVVAAGSQVGVDKLSTIERTTGERQVTYAGHPLYL